MHMPGQTDDVRVPKMDKWLGKIQNEEKWAVELGELSLEKEITEFWKRLGVKEKAKKADLTKKKEKGKPSRQVEKEKKVGKGKTGQKTKVEEGKKEPKLTKRPKSPSPGSA